MWSKSKMKLFLDTEFTDLVPGNKLISIALVAEDGEYFYAELNDTYELEDCSEFVKHYVLPYLKGGEYVMSSHECALKIGNWIEERGPDCILALDNISWDRPHLERLLEPCWPENLSKNEYFKFVIMNDDAKYIFHEYNLQIHNALDDAIGMNIAHKVGMTWEY
jgi:hypothetical protein